VDYRLDPGDPPGDQVRRLLVAQVALAREALGGEDRVLGVHAARKVGKRCRALIALASPGLVDGEARTLRRAFRDMGRLLAPLRDADVRPQALERLAVAELQPLHGLLRARTPSDAAERVAQACAALEDLQEASAGLSVGQLRWRDLGRGMRRGYASARRGLGAVRDRADDPEAVHEWRKRVKAHSYHLQLFALAWEPVMAAWSAELDRLQESLGDHHDLDVLRQELRTLSVEPELRELAERRLAAREAELVAVALATQAFDVRPPVMSAFVRGLWEAHS